MLVYRELVPRTFCRGRVPRTYERAPSKLVYKPTCIWELNPRQIVPLHSCAVSYHSAGVYEVIITLRCVLVWICPILSHTEIVLCMKYALQVGSALAIFSQEEEKE